VFSTCNQDAHFVDVYLDTTRLATIDDTNYTLCAGWLGSVPYRQGMTFELLEKEILPQHFPVSSVAVKLGFQILRRGWVGWVLLPSVLSPTANNNYAKHQRKQKGITVCVCWGGGGEVGK
jgi:hypothetical protein